MWMYICHPTCIRHVDRKLFVDGRFNRAKTLRDLYYKRMRLLEIRPEFIEDLF